MRIQPRFYAPIEGFSRFLEEQSPSSTEDLSTRLALQRIADDGVEPRVCLELVGLSLCRKG